MNVAINYCRKGEYQKSLERLQKALALGPEKLDENASEDINSKPFVTRLSYTLQNSIGVKMT